MPLETASTIDELNPNWPLGSDPKSQGDDHLRMIKEVMQNDVVPKSTGGAFAGEIVFTGGSKYNDFARLNFGTDSDSYMTHTGANMSWQNNTGNILINSDTIQLRDKAGANFAILDRTQANFVEVVAGNKGFTAPDNQFLKLGTGSDFTATHDGTNTTLRNTTGAWRNQTDDWRLTNLAATQNVITAFADTGVSLFYQGVNRLYTRANGVTVTGDISVSTSGAFGSFAQVFNGGSQAAAALRFGEAGWGFYRGVDGLYATIDNSQAAIIYPRGTTLPAATTVVTREKLEGYHDRTWVAVGRSFETVYTNSTGKPIEVAVYATTDSPNGTFPPTGSTVRFQVSADGSTWVTALNGFLERTGTGGSYSRIYNGVVTVPNGHRYRITSGEANKVIQSWSELR